MPVARPELPDMRERDADHNQIDDELDRSKNARVELEVILTGPATPSELAAFAQHGGRVQHVFVAVSYGWSGSLPRASLLAVRNELGSALHFIAAPHVVVPLLDEATRTGRVRPVWGANFAGSTLGFRGNANITIGVIDTGVDGSHSDLSGASVGFKDYTSDGAVTPRDVQGHGTHVTSIAVGTGAAFGLGPGTLRYTNAGDLTGYGSGEFLPGVIHTPSYFNGSSTLSVFANAVWAGGTSSSLRAQQSADPNGAFAQFGLISGAAPQSLNASTSNAAARYSDALGQTSPPSVTLFAVANGVYNYPAVGDGFNALSGVAPQCKWFGAKVFSDQGLGSSSDTGAAVDDLVAARVDKNVKILNLSLTSVGGSDAGLRAKVNSAVENGVLVVVAAGNGGPSQVVSDPGRARKALTVGATNDINELTTYTSAGAALLTAPDSEDYKPDLLAPGGSSYRSLILAADSNSADAESSTFSDVQPNDYRGLQGTSLSSPFAAGAAALVIDALQQAGTVWEFTSSRGPLLVKMLLSASATETNKDREVGSAGSPSLGRAAQPKDLYEGYGLLNPDAAIEAVTLELPASFTGTVSNAAPARLEWERRAWGRRVALHKTDVLTLNLTMTAAADFDLHVYAGSPDQNGGPVLRAFSTSAALGGSESLSYLAASDETAYVFVKRISGYGTFTLDAVHTVYCGNGVLDPGEDCDPGIAGSAACCSASCSTLAPDTLCDDGNACTLADHCAAGKCVAGDTVSCAVIAECLIAGACQPATGQCPLAVAVEDGNACAGGSCLAGVCVASVASNDDGGEGGASAVGGARSVFVAGARGVDADGGAGGVTASDGGGAGELLLASGGASTSSALDAGVSGADGTPSRAAVDTESGCGCSAVGAGQRAGSVFWMAAALGLFSMRRRRASGACRRSVRH
jgi:MYXO-CTERM domain-containing protein